MKKIFSVFLSALLICLCFAGCSGPNAEMTEENITATVDEAMTALKEFDTEKLEKYVDSSTLSTILGYAKDHQQFIDLGKAIFENLTYEVTAVDLENSTVTVSVCNKDLYEVASDFAQNLKSNYSTIQLLSKLSNDSFLDRKLSVLCESIDSAEMLPDSAEITLTVEQDSKNLVLVFDDDAENQVSGGALSAIKEIYS
ncbi:MAG: hypothetical protein ACI4XC_01625 [Eubacterium sp.]